MTTKSETFVLSRVMIFCHKQFKTQRSPFVEGGSRTLPPRPLGMRLLASAGCEKVYVFVEDAGRRCGRRGQRSHFRLEDAKSIIQVKKKNYIHLLDLRLPGKCAGGVHVFQGVFQRLPTKRGSVRDIAIPSNAFF